MSSSVAGKPIDFDGGALVEPAAPALAPVPGKQANVPVAAAPEDGKEEAGAPPAKKPKYTPAQKELIRKCVVDRNMGYKKILNTYPDWGLNQLGARDAVARLKATGSLDRKSGSGRRISVRTEEVVEAAREFMEGNKDATCGDLVKELGLKDTTARRILKVDLELKPLRKVTAQRVKEERRAKRLERCLQWDAEIASGALDLTAVYWTDEKLFRLGACSGGNQNLVVWVKNYLKKHEVANDLILRDDGKYQGGVSVMVSLGLSYRGKGTLRFAPAKTKINAATYLEIVENTYLPDCRELYGVPPACVFQQDGASSHTSNAVQAYCKKKFPRFWAKREWPANSPDLNPLDYFTWGYLQAAVDKKKPVCLDTLKVAIKKSVEELPLELAQRAILGFHKRVKLCAQEDGGIFKGRKLKGGDAPLLDHPVVNPGDDGDADEEDAGQGEQEAAGEAEEM